MKLVQRSDGRLLGACMKLFLTVLLGIFASFALTILAELLLLRSSISGIALLLLPEFPVVTALVGILVGLIIRDKARVAAMLSLAPWTLYMIIGTNWNHSSLSRWLITVVLVLVYSAIGVGAAVLVGRIPRVTQRTNVSA
jgi:hypothetical protein